MKVQHVRYIVSHLVLSILRVVSQERLKSERLSETALLIIMGVSIGHYEKRPMTINKLSGYLGIPRPTLTRHVQRLLKKGLLVQEGTSLFLSSSLDDPTSENIARQLVSILESACRNLSKMDDLSLPEIRPFSYIPPVVPTRI